MNYYQKIRCKILVFITHTIALPLLKYTRKAKPFPYNINELHNMPKGSLGNDLASFLTKNNLQLLSHYTRHDLKHLVLGFDTTEEGEFCLQAFMLGNGRISIPVLATVAFGCVLAPEYWHKMYLSFVMGKRSNAIQYWNWYVLLHEQTSTLQQQIYNDPKF